ncbi:uncharacterized protein LAESUDRAFT_690427 [Laetiporus sulphureus 93-53]|uniref:NADH dehydrogenase [ubiquinone] 1 beta subcomplex subunit 7 n=1 Tax=Laetiporus sulphureus 93-53 TaxID=1314785 RepID=A0A165IK13_9APHY|nr:uncharacterized protein LAESUDRAFT_690427 [Laetiporus sulphureus 93-53]KZT13187.1 hypothetical protein LAESUDRAFT_690427 [Laetiporus sulphureus 93-53]
MATSTTASQEEMKQAGIPLAWRDSCSALLIPLNVCRKQKYYLPWECEHEKHAYEKCQYEDYVRRMKLLSKQKIAAREEES